MAVLARPMKSSQWPAFAGEFIRQVHDSWPMFLTSDESSFLEFARRRLRKWS
jgi:hypothetical protein